MNEKTKEFFHRMYDEAYAYSKAAAEREKEKEALMATDDWDAVKEWHEREAQFKQTARFLWYRRSDSNQ